MTAQGAREFLKGGSRERPAQLIQSRSVAYDVDLSAAEDLGEALLDRVRAVKRTVRTLDLEEVLFARWRSRSRDS